MPVKFTTTPKKDPRNLEADPKYYAIVKSGGRVDTIGVARSINSMSTISYPDTVAVLEAFLQVVPEKLSEGLIVELGDFGSFRMSVSSQGADTPEELTIRNITDKKVVFTPGKRFKEMLANIKFQKEALN